MICESDAKIGSPIEYLKDARREEVVCEFDGLEDSIRGQRRGFQDDRVASGKSRNDLDVGKDYWKVPRTNGGNDTERLMSG